MTRYTLRKFALSEFVWLQRIGYSLIFSEMNVKSLTSISTLLVLLGTVASAQTSSERKSPTSKFYVTDVEGFSEVNTGNVTQELTEKSIIDAEGAVIETKDDSSTALVMSNGMGVYLPPDTKFSVNRFLQEPFTPNRTDLDSEPSVSQTRTMVSSGSVGLCSGKLVAGSSMTYDTPQGSVNILSQSTQKVVIQVSGDTTTVSLLEGSVTLRGENMAGGESLQSGQQAVIRSRGLNQPPEITIGSIPLAQMESLESTVNGACQARKKVYFDSAERVVETEGVAGELFAIELTPVDPTSIGPVSSPAGPAQ